MDSQLVQTVVLAAVLSGAALYLLRRVVLAVRTARRGRDAGGCGGGCGCSH